MLDDAAFELAVREEAASELAAREECLEPVARDEALELAICDADSPELDEPEETLGVSAPELEELRLDMLFCEEAGEPSSAL